MSSRRSGGGGGGGLGGTPRRRVRSAFGARALRHLCGSGGGHSALLRDGSAWCRERPLPGWGSLCGMAMAEGERTECAETPRDEPPADGALKRAEELKTQANDYFKGASGPDGVREGGQRPRLWGCQARRGTMATRSGSLGAGQALQSSQARGGGSGWTTDWGELLRSGYQAEATHWGD